ncbi:MAG: aquaporin family protein [Deltaproteobacteria bacterium]|nr:aquaporin family protein [Deltaproteobacteria bacterium]
MGRVHEFWGELIGTFILVFFGCGSVAVTVLFNAHTGLFQVAGVWGLGVMLAIYATRHLSCAHLNPAVSLAMVFGRRMTARKLPVYLIGQFSGAFIAAVVLYSLFCNSISAYEVLNGITRGAPESIKTAMIFGEFYPNPGVNAAIEVSFWNAFGVEATGTFLLVLMIFSLTEGCNVGRPDDALAPLFIGLTVAAIISVLAPLTQAGLNPARDFGPRLFAWLAGWKAAAFPDQKYGFVIIYVLGPLVGGTTASLLFVRLLEPMMKAKSENSCCNKINKI